MKLRRSLRVAAIGGLLLCLASPVSAQRFLLRDGRVIDARGLVVRNGQVVRESGDNSTAGHAVPGIPVHEVVRLDWPEPPALREAAARLLAGAPAEALVQAEAVARAFTAFARVPGSWWADAALLRARALHATGRRGDAERAAREVAQAAQAPVAAALAQLLLAEISLAGGKTEAAAALVDAVMAGEPPPAVAAAGWVLRGDLALKRGQADAALDAYLHVPAFFPEREELRPRVLLGSARAYRAFGDSTRSNRAYLELKDRFASSAEAAAARAEAP